MICAPASLSRRDVLKGAAGAGALASAADTAWAAGAEQILTPEDFGAVGDGKTNDTDAFSALSREVNRRGGGIVQLRRTTYVVGRQHYVGSDQAYMAAAEILHFANCTKDVELRGNGATLIAAAGLRYGSFDPATGAALQPQMPFLDRRAMAIPYIAMVHVSGCSGAIRISDLTLDGNAGALHIGGKWGDVGWQVPGSGMSFIDNRGDEIVQNVVCRDHPLDGILIDDVAAEAGIQRRFTRVVSDRNGRQGCSIVGGTDYVFDRCRFSRTGRGRLVSSPGAGVDIEPEGGKKVRNLRFLSCDIIDNSGCGIVADGGPSSNVQFVSSTFVGIANWAAWPRAPHYTFSGCTFVGAISNCYGSEDAAAATQFIGCTFRDMDPTSGKLAYLSGGTDGWIADLSSSLNIRFSSCRFELTGTGRLPWSTGAIYDRCTMRQRATGIAYPRGTWLGQSTVIGNVALDGSRVLGSLTVNGKLVERS